MSYSAEVYYNGSHRDHPVIVRTDGEVDALIDALLAEPFSNSMANLYIIERPRPNGLADHELSIAVDADSGVGGLWYLNSVEGTWFSRGARSNRDEVFYCFVGHDRDFPPDSEISIALIRQATKEFLASGGQRPSCVQWQPHRTEKVTPAS
jgi:Immunity protein Imm1